MSTERQSSGFSQHPNFGLLMSGGYDGSTKANTLESTIDGRSFVTNFREMPDRLHHHCQVRWRKTIVPLA